MTLDKLTLEIRNQKILGRHSAEALAEGLLHLFTSPVAKEAPAPEEVERVAKAISPYLMRSYTGTNPDVDDQASGRNTALHVAGLAIAAMRPVSVDQEKLAEIRARHEHLDGQLSKRTTEITAYEGYSAHADRAFLLSVLEGVNHDAD